MADYIEREAALAAIRERCAPCGEGIEALKSVPAADVAPVRDGEWLLRHEGYGHYWECSACHTNPCIYVTKDTKFCPNCGAKMDGDE